MQPRRHVHGRGVAKNEALAVKLWQAAAGQGGARAQCNLGNVRAGGRGAAKNEARAAALSKRIVAMRRIHRAFQKIDFPVYDCSIHVLGRAKFSGHGEVTPGQHFLKIAPGLKCRHSLCCGIDRHRHR